MFPSAMANGDLGGVDFLVTSFEVVPSLVQDLPDWAKPKIRPLPLFGRARALYEQGAPILGTQDFPVHDASSERIASGLNALGLVPLEYHIYPRRFSQKGGLVYRLNIFWRRRGSPTNRLKDEDRVVEVDRLRNLFIQLNLATWSICATAFTKDNVESVVVNHFQRNQKPPSMTRTHIQVCDRRLVTSKI